MLQDVIPPSPALFRWLAQHSDYDGAMTDDGTFLTPRTIQRLQSAVPPALAMLAGMQLEVFTALRDGPQAAPTIASRLGLPEKRLKRLH
jgi:hypothetical protein